MSLDIILSGLTLLSFVLAPILYVWRTTVSRIDNLEQETKTKMSENEVRQLVDDKLESVKDNLHDIKLSLQQILDKLIDTNKK